MDLCLKTGHKGLTWRIWKKLWMVAGTLFLSNRLTCGSDSQSLAVIHLIKELYTFTYVVRMSRMTKKSNRQPTKMMPFENEV